jgi:hypothetical protein
MLLQGILTKTFFAEIYAALGSLPAQENISSPHTPLRSLQPKDSGSVFTTQNP